MIPLEPMSTSNHPGDSAAVVHDSAQRKIVPQQPTAGPTVDVDLTAAGQQDEVHEQLALALGFPDCYGKNWDAFLDCITTLEAMPRKIRITGMKSLAGAFPLEAALLRKSLDDFRATPAGSAVEVTLE